LVCWHVDSDRDSIAGRNTRLRPPGVGFRHCSPNELHASLTKIADYGRMFLEKELLRLAMVRSALLFVAFTYAWFSRPNALAAGRPAWRRSP
jgi:hypothetical protein